MVNPRLPDSRLDALYEADGFGGETTMRAKVIRELIDEIRRLRRQLDAASPTDGSCSPELAEAAVIGSFGRPARRD